MRRAESIDAVKLELIQGRGRPRGPVGGHASARSRRAIDSECAIGCVAIEVTQPEARRRLRE
jgi:hypothetical protein